MGDPGKKHKKYARPRKKFELVRMKEENSLLSKYGLKNKKEIWKAEFRINKIRKQAKDSINKPQQAGQIVSKLNNLGFKVSAVDDILALTKEDLLERRLQTVLARKGLAKTMKEARQLIVHKHIRVDKNIVNIPSFIVSLSNEDKISVVKVKNKEKTVAIKEPEQSGNLEEK